MNLVTARIAWVNKATGQKGLGTISFPETEARLLAQQLNDQFPHIEHTAQIVEAPPISETTTPI